MSSSGCGVPTAGFGRLLLLGFLPYRQQMGSMVTDPWGAVALRLWNSLPVEMCCLTDTTTFKKNLKTLLFKTLLSSV
jgi:hypothetical protein